MKKKGLSILISCAVACTMVFLTFAWTSPALAESRVIYTTSNVQGNGDGSEAAPYKDFADALQSARDGDTIIIEDKAFLNDDQGKPLVIDKAITIKSKQAGQLAVLNTRRSGIVLHADTVFEDINLAESSGQYPGIYANGNNLTLKNVQSDPSAVQIHVFAGGLKIGNSYYGGRAPEEKDSEIRIEGPNAFGGMLFLGGENTGQERSSRVTVHMKNLSTNQVKAVYGYGAQSPDFDSEDWFSNLGNIPDPSPNDAYCVQGDVEVNLEDVSGPSINLNQVQGRTEINYTSHSGYQEDGSFRGIDAFTLVKGNLKLTQLSGGVDGQLDLTIHDGARFDFSSIAEAENNQLHVNNFVGGGTLVLPREPGRFTILGQIDATKTTTIEIDKSNEGVALENAARYVKTTVSDDIPENTFRFPASYGERTLVKDYDGWLTNKVVTIYYDSNEPDWGSVSEEVSTFTQGSAPGHVTAIPQPGSKFLYWATVVENPDGYTPKEIVSDDVSFSPHAITGGMYEELYVAFFKKMSLSIDAHNKNIHVPVGTSLTDVAKKAHVIAKIENDEITHEVKLEQDGGYNPSKPGTYKVLYSVEKYGIKESLELTIVITAPVKTAVSPAVTHPVQKKVSPVISGIKSKTYTGKSLTQALVVKAHGKTLKSGSDYTVSYKNNKSVGKAYVTVKLRGKYSGSKTVTFAINPKATSISKVSKAKKAATIIWKKQSAKMSTSRITGYHIRLATNSKFTSNKKVVTIKGYNRASTKVTKLKGGKKYYVSIRTYKKVGNITYYSPWSKSRTVTTGR